MLLRLLVNTYYIRIKLKIRPYTNMTENYCIDDTMVQTLVKSFFNGSLPDVKGKSIALTWEKQEKFLKQTIHSTHFKKYPGSLKFSRLFFKKLIESLEPEQEVHDDVYQFLCSIMGNDEDNVYYRHYIISNSLNNLVTVKETKNMVLNGTTGLRTWEAALMLSDWALCNKEIFLNKSILELGSGVGFTGITIAKYCDVKSVIMTDFHEEVLDTINNNILINFPESIPEHNAELIIYKNGHKDIGVIKLDWNDTDHVPQILRPDIIIGADIVYDPSILQPLVSVLKYFHNRNKDVEIYIASVIRNADTFKEFLKVLETPNFRHMELIVTGNVHIKWDEYLVRCLLRINKG